MKYRRVWRSLAILIILPNLGDGLEVESSPRLVQEFLGASSDLAADAAPNGSWHFDVISSGGPNFYKNIYFLEGSVEGIRSSSALQLGFTTAYAYAVSANSAGAAWYFDAGGMSPSTGTVYYLNGSLEAIAASSPLLLDFQGSSLNLNPIPSGNKAWYYDGYLESVDLLANVYFLSGTIGGIDYSGTVDVSFLGPSPNLMVDSNRNAAWYYDLSQLPEVGSEYQGHVYYMVGSEGGIALSNALTCTFQSSYAPLVADAAENRAWYADSHISSGDMATIYFLQGGLPNIAETHGSFTFTTPYVSVVADPKPNGAWYYNYYNDTAGFSGTIHYLEGSSMEIASSPDISFPFQTFLAVFLGSGTENRGWYFDRGGSSSPGFNGNVYYLSGSLGGISSSAAAEFSFQTQSADLFAGVIPDTAWYFDNYKDSTTPPFSSNVYYLLGSLAGISSSSSTVSFNTNWQDALLDSSSGGLWYGDVGDVGTSFEGRIYYLVGSAAAISSASVAVPFNADTATMRLAGPGAIWYFDRANPAASVYYIKALEDSLVVYGWRSGLQGALLNSVFNGSLAQARAFYQKRGRNGQFSNSKNLAWNGVLSESNLFADALKIQNCGPKKGAPYQFEIVPFYDFIQQKKQGSIPAFENNVAGALATFDARVGSFTMGGGVAYSYNHAHLKEGFGHANINQETGVVYSSWENERLYAGAAVWGGFYQLKGVREFSGTFTSHYSTQGYTLTPHLELKGFALSKDNWLAVNPFAMGDWVVIWQKEYSEKGVGGTSVAVPSQCASLLRTEAGVMIEQTVMMNWGRIELLEKGSYVNQTPFQQNTLLPLFVGSAPAFSIGTGALTVQNLGAVEFKTTFYPSCRNAPYFGLDLQGEFGSKLSSYFASVEMGIDF